MTIDLQELDGVLSHIEGRVSPPPFEVTLKAADRRRLVISRAAFGAVVLMLLVAIPSVLAVSTFADRNDTPLEVAGERVDEDVDSSAPSTSSVEGDSVAVQIARESRRWAIVDWFPASEEDLVALQSEAASVRLVDHEGQSFLVVSAPCATARWEIIWQATGFVVGSPIERDPEADTAAIECGVGLSTLEQLPVEPGQFVALEVVRAGDDEVSLRMSVSATWSLSLWRTEGQISPATTFDPVTTTTEAG